MIQENKWWREEDSNLRSLRSRFTVCPLQMQDEDTDKKSCCSQQFLPIYSEDYVAREASALTGHHSVKPGEEVDIEPYNIQATPGDDQQGNCRRSTQPIGASLTFNNQQLNCIEHNH